MAPAWRIEAPPVLVAVVPVLLAVEFDDPVAEGPAEAEPLARASWQICTAAAAVFAWSAELQVFWTQGVTALVRASLPVVHWQIRSFTLQPAAAEP